MTKKLTIYLEADEGEEFEQEDFEEFFEVLDEHWRPEGTGYIMPDLSWEEYTNEGFREMLINEEDSINR